MISTKAGAIRYETILCDMLWLETIFAFIWHHTAIYNLQSVKHTHTNYCVRFSWLWEREKASYTHAYRHLARRTRNTELVNTRLAMRSTFNLLSLWCCIRNAWVCKIVHSYPHNILTFFLLLVYNTSCTLGIALISCKVKRKRKSKCSIEIANEISQPMIFAFFLRLCPKYMCLNTIWNEIQIRHFTNVIHQQLKSSSKTALQIVHCKRVCFFILHLNNFPTPEVRVITSQWDWIECGNHQPFEGKFIQNFFTFRWQFSLLPLFGVHFSTSASNIGITTIINTSI